MLACGDSILHAKNLHNAIPSTMPFRADIVFIVQGSHSLSPIWKYVLKALPYSAFLSAHVTASARAAQQSLDIP